MSDGNNLLKNAILGLNAKEIWKKKKLFSNKFKYTNVFIDYFAHDIKKKRFDISN